MKHSGFLSRALLILGIACLFVHGILADSGTIAEQRMQNFGLVVIACLAEWGIITLLSNIQNKSAEKILGQYVVSSSLS